jgi:putative flippase GtrA
LYAFRVGVGDFERLVPGFRKLVLAHAGIVRLGIVIGCLVPYNILPRSLNNSTVVTAIFAAATAFGYLCLYLLTRALK